MATERLTEKQTAFCREFAKNGGNAYAASKTAGYKNPNVDGYRLLDNDRVKAYIKELSRPKERAEKRDIADARERQEFWSMVMRGVIKDAGGEEAKLSDRLKAAELLGKSQLDFTTNVNVNLDATGELLAAIRGSALRPGLVAPAIDAVAHVVTEDEDDEQA